MANAAQQQLIAEQTRLTAEVEAMDFDFTNGAKVCEVSYYAKTDRLAALRGLIHAAGASRRKGCPNTAALISANID